MTAMDRPLKPAVCCPLRRHNECRWGDGVPSLVPWCASEVVAAQVEVAAADVVAERMTREHKNAEAR